MSEHDEEGVSYAEQLRDKNVQTLPGGFTHHTREQVTEGRTKQGGRFKITKDELGHETTDETTADGEERRHVRINLG